MRLPDRLLLVLLPLLATLPATADEWWNAQWQQRRPVEARTGGGGGSGTPLSVIDFFTGGAVQPDGRDVRVIVDGRPVRHAVIVPPTREAGDFCRVAFELPPGRHEVYVYYDSESAGPAFTDFEPKRGLLLRTTRFNGGNPADLAGMRRIVERSGPLHGADFVEKVFHGFNLFGPNSNTVSQYRGTLMVPRSGVYEVTTSSDDASFLLIDGKVVSAWPGWHGAVADARHAEKIRLTRGAHAFEYLQVNGSGGFICVAAWRPPGQERFAPIEAFPTVARGKVGPPQRRDGTPVGAFSAKVLEEADFGDETALLVELKDRSASPLAGSRWQFGDGAAGSGAVVRHVYVESGRYTVTLQGHAGGREVRVKQNLRLERRWAQQHRQRPRPLAIMKHLQADQLPHLNVDALRAVTRLLGSFDESRRVQRAAARQADTATRLASLRAAAARAVVDRGGEMPPDLLTNQAVLLSHALRDSEEGAEAALAVLEKAEPFVRERPRHRAVLLREKGDIHFYYRQDLDRALEEYDKVVGRYTDLPDAVVRVTRIRIGDLYRKRGEYAKASEQYGLAEAMLADDRDMIARTLRRGQLAQKAEEHLQRGSHDAAGEAINLLEWEFPKQKLSGQSTRLRVKLALARENRAEAVKQVEDLLRVAPRCAYAPGLLLDQADALAALDRPADARAALVRLIRQYPDAETEALEGAVKRLRSKDLQTLTDPAAMLAGADAVARLGRREEALTILQKLREQHPQLPQDLRRQVKERMEAWKRAVAE